MTSLNPVAFEPQRSSSHLPRWCALPVAVLALPLTLAVRSGCATVRELTPQKTAVSEVLAAASGLAVEPFSVTTADGYVIRGWYGGANGAPVVVLAHGYSDSRAAMLPQAKFLADAGFGVVLFDWRGHGSSDGRGTTWGERERSDLEAVLSWTTLRAPDAAIGALGFSMGAMAIVEFSAHDASRRIRAFVLEGMFPNLEEVAYQNASAHGNWTGLPAIWAMRLFGPHLEEVRPEDHLRELPGDRLLLVYGSEERAKRFDLLGRMRKAAPEAEMMIIAGATHGRYVDTDGEGLRARLVTFFDRTLRSDDHGNRRGGTP